METLTKTVSKYKYFNEDRIDNFEMACKEIAKLDCPNLEELDISKPLIYKDQ